MERSITMDRTPWIRRLGQGRIDVKTATEHDP